MYICMDVYIYMYVNKYIYICLYLYLSAYMNNIIMNKNRPWSYRNGTYCLNAQIDYHTST